MKYKSFHIENYKGIKKIDIDLSVSPDFKVYAFIGLNESGKTTLLEAMNDCDNEVPTKRRHELIPKGRAGGFTGSTLIEATITLDDIDKKTIQDFIKNELKVRFSEIIVNNEFTISREYKFENSTPLEDAEYTYTGFARIKKTASSKSFVKVSDPEKKLWRFARNKLYPDIIFYRDFLTKFPEKIYLENPEDDPKKQEYLNIIEDVLTSINPNYNVSKSLIERMNDRSDANSQALEAVENELGAKISQVVFEAWSKIQNVSKKQIIAKAGTDESGHHYLKFTVKDGLLNYLISERSLGFRWFFTFLLYTEFRKERVTTSGEILFLLDEPASNLHQAAQKSLLGTFENLITKSRLAYTTHSHHLINPMWLDNAYIVRNKALKYEDEDNFTIVNTEIEASLYKKFVSEHPTQTSYFQPILDVLDYQPGLLENVPSIVITEGKFDYSTFTYFSTIVLKRNRSKYSFYPGHGAAKLDLPIALYESWARPYVVLLDSDREGNIQKKRYIKELSGELSIFTLEDVDSSFKNISTEDLFNANEKLKITQEFNPKLNAYNKSAFNTGIRLLIADNKVPDYISEGTKKKINKILDFLDSQF
jgi:ABC-type molybdenum transport system ATPase subunit/photorepair protein PhrA